MPESQWEKHPGPMGTGTSCHLAGKGFCNWEYGAASSYFFEFESENGHDRVLRHEMDRTEVCRMMHGAVAIAMTGKSCRLQKDGGQERVQRERRSMITVTREKTY